MIPKKQYRVDIWTRSGPGISSHRYHFPAADEWDFHVRLFAFLREHESEEIIRYQVEFLRGENPDDAFGHFGA